jgi:hypothetical protein
MQEVNHLKNAHYEAMRHIGYTDDEIEKDWELFCKEYDEYLDLVHRFEGEYKPFGSSVATVHIRDKEEEEVPW